jgi:hypothetical protein
MVPLPGTLDFHDRITFTIGLVNRPDAHAVAERVHGWLRGPRGQRLLVEAGFLPAAQVSALLPW